MPGGATLPFLMAGFMVMAIAVRSTYGIIVSEDVLSMPVHCTTNANRSVIEVSNPHQEIFVILSSDFKYLQISLNLSSCYRHTILRGNRYLTAKILDTKNMEEVLSMDLNHTVIGGGHGYHINIESETVNFTNTINTQTSCGKFQGFRVKAIGATMCVKKLYQEDYDFLYQHDDEYVNTSSKLSKSRLIRSYSEKDNDYMKNLRELNRWAAAAYVMAICFSLTVYIVSLISSLLESGVIRRVLNARGRDSSYVPVNDV